MSDRLFILFQYLLPHHLLSRAAGWLANCRWNWVKNPFISWFVKRYDVDMSQALEETPTACPRWMWRSRATRSFPWRSTTPCAPPRSAQWSS